MRRVSLSEPVSRPVFSSLLQFARANPRHLQSCIQVRRFVSAPRRRARVQDAAARGRLRGVRRGAAPRGQGDDPREGGRQRAGRRLSVQHALPPMQRSSTHHTRRSATGPAHRLTGIARWLPWAWRDAGAAAEDCCETQRTSRPRARPALGVPASAIDGARRRGGFLRCVSETVASLATNERRFTYIHICRSTCYAARLEPTSHDRGREWPAYTSA